MYGRFCIKFPQSGMKGEHLVFITKEFGNYLDEGKEIRVVFCDISKPFNRVWHIGLLKKIESIGIQGPLFSWIKYHSSNRKQSNCCNK